MKISLNQNIMYTCDRPDTVFTSGQGSWLVDHNGKRYLDFVQGWAVNCLGHSPAILTQALTEQAHKLWNCSPAFYNEPQLMLAEQLTQASGLDKAFFTSTGAEANEGAIKLARKWGQVHKAGAFKIITMDGGFHGRTLATMSATGKSSFSSMFNPKVDGFIKVPFNNLEACEQAIDNSVAAILLEPIQGEAGVIPATKAFIQGLSKLCKQHNILLMFDEVQTGLGRTGKLFAAHQYDITPDVMTLGKGLGGGAPLGAVLARESVCCFEAGEQGGTFSGNALMCSIGLEVIKTINDNDFLEQSQRSSLYLQQALSLIFGKGTVRGMGLLLAVELEQPAAKDIVADCFEQGLLINAPNDHCLRFMPALNVSFDEIDKMISVLTQVLKN
jgi:acetylornithine/N-succinyldiaminopimelate aminotransferase